MNKGTWTRKGTGGSTDQKRPHQFVAEGCEKQYLPNKKQAAEVLNNNDNSINNKDMLNSNDVVWGNAPGFHSSPSQFFGRSYESEAAKNVSFGDGSFLSIFTNRMNMGYALNENPFGNASSFNSSIPHVPSSGFCFDGGFKKVRVSEVKDSEVLMSGTVGTTFSTDPADNGINNNHTYDKGNENVVPIGDIYHIADRNAISTGQSYSKVEGIVSTGQTYKDSMPPNNSTVYLDQSYKPIASNISSSLIYNKAPETTMTTSCAFNMSDDSFLTIGQSNDKGESTIISFGGSVDDYDEMLAGLTPALKKEATNVVALVNLSASVDRNPSKKKDDNKSSKVLSTNFPPNVRCLLSTGILDGVPVKYIAWSREKQLPGVIKGSGYLCGCQSCKYSSVINGFEFERHAGCKTKHPNNHIYFENGKTIYGAVQELKSTPQNMLLDAIQNVAGSPINQESFRLWKVSFLAASGELKRIYGSKDVQQSF